MAVKYSLYLEPQVHDSRPELPGYVRQEIRARIAALAATPRPSNSKELQLPGDVVPAGVEIRRLRVGHWRIIYAVHDRE